MAGKTGILLVNLGSPDAPTSEAVRRYLGQFLHDKRVIDTSRWIWCPILHGIILRFRPKKSAKKYAQIWSLPAEFPGTEAPLVRITRAQATALQKKLNTDVEIGMRYGSPSIGNGINKLKSQGCEEIRVLPLYPQFSHTTTSAVKDELEGIGGVEMLEDYHNHPAYIQAVCDSLQSHILGLNWAPDAVLMSYHGLPQRYVDQGDPYAKQCIETSRLIEAALGETPYVLRTAFQSRFGKLEWVKPYTEPTLIELAQKGRKNVVVITPGFAADCLETLEEIDIEARAVFHENGGEKFSVVPCLNADVAHIDMLESLATKPLSA